MKSITLEMTHCQLHSLTTDLEKVKSSSTTVKVDKAALQALILDHGRLVRHHRAENGGVI